MAADTAVEDEVKVATALNWALWRRLLAFATVYRGALAFLVTCALFVAACDTLLPIWFGRTVQAVSAGDYERAVWSGVLPYFLTCCAFAVCIFGFILAAGILNTRVSADLRAALFDKLQALPFAYFDKRATGWILARSTSDCATLSRVMAWATLDVCWGTSVLLMVSITMLALDWQLGLLTLAVVPPLLVISRLFRVRLLKLVRQVRRLGSLLTGAYSEGIQGLRTTKSLSREKRNLAEFDDLATQMYRVSMRHALVNAVFIPVVTTLCAVAAGAALWAGGWKVNSGAIELGTLVTFLAYAGFFAQPAQELAHALSMVQNAQAAGERVVGLLDEPVTVRDKAAVRTRLEIERETPAQEGVAEDGFPDRIDVLEFRNVSFEYLPGRPVLRDFSLVVPRGTTVALVGPTGGGKSTIVSLACRFYEPTRGQVLLDGVDYRERSLAWYQRQLGVVLQQPHLFNETLRANVRYGRLDATDAEIDAAARAADVTSFSETLPNGLDTVVGEGGSQLSTGQKQLASLARAILADPQVFVMDEATSSVDTESEHAIQRAVERALGGRISFVIAHRLSTIRRADVILFIDNGAAVERGTHRELMRARGRYWELYTGQDAAEREAVEMGAA